MKIQSFYYNLAKKGKELELNFMIAALLKSRMKLGLEQEEEAPDEDVNIYLANLLLSFAQPDYMEEAGRFIKALDMDIYEMAESSSENAAKYFIYKINADNLLISLGIFQNIHPSEHYIGRAKIYYELAGGYNFKIYRRATATALVLEKLAKDFEKYHRILSNVREDYFNLIKKISEGDFGTFVSEMKTFEEKLLLREREDSFLDLYSQWLKSKDAKLEKRVVALAKDIQIVDSTFNFKMPSYARAG